MLLMILPLLMGCETPIDTKAEVTVTGEPAIVRMLVPNIGKADALIIQVGTHSFLVDAGTAKQYEKLEKAFAALGITHLDAVFLTHTHSDHGGGMKKLADSDITVDNWYASAYYVEKTPEKHQAFLAAQKRGQSVQFLKAGDSVPIADDAYFEIVGPVSLAPDAENNNSLAMILHTSQGRIFLAGDMQVPEELEVLQTGRVVPCEVLKVGHHGDNTATSYNLATAIRPQIAVISTSTKEEPDTPSGDVLRTLRAVGATVLVTQDMTDAIMITLQNGVAEAFDISFQ